MVELRRIKVYLSLMLLLQFTEAAKQHFLSFTVRDGDEATLPCENVIDNQEKCDGTWWIFSSSGSSAADLEVDLVAGGQIGEDATAQSHRLSVTETCSLVIQQITAQDAGLYHCQQLRSGRQAEDTQVDLSVINMKKHEHGEQVILSCSVSTHRSCRHTVKWMYDGKDADEDVLRCINMQTSQPECSVTVTFPASYFTKSKYHELLKCEVTDGFSHKVQRFPFSPRSSGEDATTSRVTTEGSTESRTTSTVTSAPRTWWLYVVVAIGLVALVVIAVAAIGWKRAKGDRTQMDDNTAGPEDGVSYASVSYTRRTGGAAQVQVKNDDEVDSVTYSSVNASSPSVGGSADPSSLYATISKPRKPETTVPEKP